MITIASATLTRRSERTKYNVLDQEERTNTICIVELSNL